MPVLQLGSQGVGDLQQLLLEAGQAVAADELATGYYGPSTEAAVRDFQARHVGPGNQVLRVDGVVGPQTAYALRHRGGAASYVQPGWACDVAAIAHPWRQAVVAAAVRELGAREEPDGSNRGPRVDRYTRPRLGIRWCSAFASWCYMEAPQGSPFGRKDSSWGLYLWAERSGCLVPDGAPLEPADLWVILRGKRADEDRHGHTGLVATPEHPAPGLLCTVEGNASNAVRGLVRPRASITAFIRVMQ